MAKVLRKMRDLMAALPESGKVRHLFRQFNLSFCQGGPVPSAHDFARALGFEVHCIDLPGRMSGRLVSSPLSKRGFRIEVNAKHSVEARRWAVLHEIAHFFLHTDFDDPFHADTAWDASGGTFYEDPTLEHEANRFAEILVFGDGNLHAAMTRANGDRARAARYLGVSVAMLDVALKRRRTR